MSAPAELRYSPEHQWARIDGDHADLGVTAHAQESLGEVVHFAPLETGAPVDVGGTYGELESVKAVSDLVSPLAGEVVAYNQDVIDQPELVNEDPYSAWLVRLRLADPSAVRTMLDAGAYQELLTR